MRGAWCGQPAMGGVGWTGGGRRVEAAASAMVGARITDEGCWLLSRHRLAGGAQEENLVNDGGQVRQNEVVVDVANPGRLDEEGGATSGARGFGVRPLVANDEGTVQAQLPFEGRLDEQAGFGFAAGASVGFIMRADEDVIERKGAAQQVVHPVQLAAGLIATRQAGLIGGGDEQEAGCLQLFQQRESLLVQMEFLQRQRADLMLPVNPYVVQYAIALQKYTWFHTSEIA